MTEEKSELTKKMDLKLKGESMSKQVVQTLYVGALVCMVSACSTIPRPDTAEDIPDRVLARIDELNSRPEWFKEGESFKVSDGNFVFLGSTVIPGDHRVDAGIRIAQNNAKSAVCGVIEQSLEFVFQNAEEGTGFDANQVRYIGAEACKLTASSIRPGKIYWEKVATTKDTGERVTRYRMFCNVSISEADLKAAILDVARKRAGAGGLSADFAKKVDRQWDRFVGEADGQSAPTKEHQALASEQTR